MLCAFNTYPSAVAVDSSQARFASESVAALTATTHHFRGLANEERTLGGVTYGPMRTAVLLEHHSTVAGRVVKQSGDVVFCARLRLRTPGEDDVDADVLLVHLHRPHVPRTRLKRPCGVKARDDSKPAPIGPFSVGRDVYGGDCLAMQNAWHMHMPCDCVVLSDTLVLVHVSALLSPAYVVPVFREQRQDAPTTPSRRVDWVEEGAQRPRLLLAGPLH